MYYVTTNLELNGFKFSTLIQVNSHSFDLSYTWNINRFYNSEWTRESCQGKGALYSPCTTFSTGELVSDMLLSGGVQNSRSLNSFAFQGEGQEKVLKLSHPFLHTLVNTDFS